MSQEARRIRAATREAWNAILAGFRSKGIELDTWPEKDAPKPRAYSIEIPTRALSPDKRSVVELGPDRQQEAIVRKLYDLHTKIMKELAKNGADTLLIKKAAAAEILFGKIQLTAVVGFAKRKVVTP